MDETAGPMRDLSLVGEFPTVRAQGVPTNVVAAKKPGKWIIRAIGSFSSPEQLRSSVERFVGKMDDEIEWSQASYFVPSYLHYGSGDIPGRLKQRGVYIFRATSDGADTYRDAERLGDLDGR